VPHRHGWPALDGQRPDSAVNQLSGAAHRTRKRSGIDLASACAPRSRRDPGGHLLPPSTRSLRRPGEEGAEAPASRVPLQGPALSNGSSWLLGGSPWGFSAVLPWWLFTSAASPTGSCFGRPGRGGDGAGGGHWQPSRPPSRFFKSRPRSQYATPALLQIPLGGRSASAASPAPLARAGGPPGLSTG